MGFRAMTTAAGVNTAVAAAVQEVTGRLPEPAGSINSDGALFSWRGASLPRAPGTCDRDGSWRHAPAQAIPWVV